MDPPLTFPLTEAEQRAAGAAHVVFVEAPPSAVARVWNRGTGG